MSEFLVVDAECESYAIEKVEISDGEATVTFDGGWCTVIPTDRVDVGDTLTLFGPRFGERRGVAVNGRIIEYADRNAQRIRFDREQREDERRRKRSYEERKPLLDARIQALPQVLREQIEERLDEKPEFAWDHMGLDYCLFAFEQGAEFAKALKTAKAVKEFRDLPYDEQRKRVPAMDDGHSGNTFGMAVSVAYSLVTAPAPSGARQKEEV